jgi:HEPN domain-containing protein
MMDKQEHINYWLKTSEMDLSSMETIHHAGKYTVALFMGHLALEKLLKAFWVKTHPDNFPPKTHNLLKIAEEAEVELNESEIAFLLEVNEFNLETRYPDFKLDFYKKCTKQFSSDYILKIKEIYKCIAGQI